MKHIFLPIILALSIFGQSNGFAQDLDYDMKRAEVFYSEGKYNEAAELYIKWIKLRSNNQQVNDTLLLLNLTSSAGICYYNAGQFQLAETLMIKTLEFGKIQFGEHSLDYAVALNNLAGLYLAIGEYGQAEPLVKQAQEISKHQLGENHPDYATILNTLALLYGYMGEYNKAESLMKQTIEIDKSQVGLNSRQYATHLNNLAILYSEMGRFDQALPIVSQALEIAKIQYGENHPQYATQLSNLAVIYLRLGNFELAEPLMKHVVEITKSQLGENHPNYSRSINNLAELYKAMGRYELSEPLLKLALEVDKIQLGENHTDYAKDLNNLAGLYTAMGRYHDAEPLFKQVIEINKTQLGQNHPDYALALNNLAQLYAVMGNLIEAESLMKQVQTISKVQLGEDHPQYSIILNNLAQVYAEMGQYEQAELLMKKVIEIDRIQLGVSNPQYASHLNNLGKLYIDIGQFKRAEPLLLQAIGIAEKQCAISCKDYYVYLENCADLYQEMGHNSQSEQLYNKAFSVLKDFVLINTGYLSEVELDKFIETLIFKLEIYQSFNYQQAITVGEKGNFAIDIELYQKGLLMNSVIETRKRILNSGDTSLINSYQTIMAIRKQADKLYSIPIEQRYEDPVMLETKANDLEKDLKLKSKEYSRSLEESEITWRQIQEKMKPDEAVVEFASFGYYNIQWTDSTLYCALVLRKQDTIPHMVYLFEQKQLAEALPKPGNSSDADINNTYATLRGTQLVPDSSWYQGKYLYNLVWKPLDSLLSGIKTVNYACSGLLNSVSFAAIPDATGKLLCDKYALNQYSSTRNLAIETNELPIIDVIIYGGIQYEMDTTLMITNSRQYSKSDSLALAYNSTRSGNKRGNGFDELLGTREEANVINALFKEKKITTNNYTGATANEESFKAMASKKSPSVIHLSTHGFYNPDTVTQTKRSNELQFMGSELNRFQYSPDPLLRSGIVLAGANRVWRGEPVPDGVEDGILTAKDVSQLNLSNTQLVVLSACQTGLGDVKGSEGVFGLQRAFKMAGVKYLMMSLWNVPDKETKEFMEKFYSNWLSGTPIRQAFQTTQQEMRYEYPKEPYKWAAFILVE